MKQGTVSILVGCHSIIHSILVFISWKKVYGKYPAFRQTVCIFLHDIGHIGLNYLDDVEEKRKYWRLGAEIAYCLFGEKGFLLIAGHSTHSGEPISDLHKPDKYSWYIAPFWWLYLNTFFEPKLRMGYSRIEAVRRFKSQVKQSIETNAYRSNHSMYLERCRDQKSARS